MENSEKRAQLSCAIHIRMFKCISLNNYRVRDKNKTYLGLYGGEGRGDGTVDRRGVRGRGKKR